MCCLVGKPLLAHACTDPLLRIRLADIQAHKHVNTHAALSHSTCRLTVVCMRAHMQIHHFVCVMEDKVHADLAIYMRSH